MLHNHLNRTATPPKTAFALLLLPIAAITLRRRNPLLKSLALILLTATIGCGARINTGLQSNATNAPKSYTIAVSGTATSPTGTILQHAATVTLILQPSN